MSITATEPNLTWQPHGGGRQILSEERIEVRGLTYRFVGERVATPTRWRFDENHHTFVIHLAGRLRSLWFEYASGPHGSVQPRPGDVWVIPAGQRCDAVLQGDSIEFVEITVPEKALGDAPLRSGIGYNDAFLYESLRRMRVFASREDVTGMLLRETLGEAVRLHLRDQYTLGRPAAGAAPRRLTARKRKLVLDHLDAELASDISLESLAELTEMPVGAFVAAFTSAFAITPYQYVLNRRIEEAQRLLATTEMPIGAVGAAVGFSTPSHFASTFRQRVGVTPSQYRAGAGQ